MTQHEIANIHEFLYKEGLKRILHAGALDFDESSKQMQLTSDYRRRIFDTDYYWLIFSTGVEFLLKAIMIKRGALDLAGKKRTARQHHSLPEVDSVYQAADAHVWVSNHDQNLISRLRSQGVISIWSLNIPTMIEVAERGAAFLERQAVLTKPEAKALKERSQCLASIRRNFECHTFMGTRIGEIDQEMSSVYLPLINQLLMLW